MALVVPTRELIFPSGKEFRRLPAHLPLYVGRCVLIVSALVSSGCESNLASFFRPRETNSVFSATRRLIPSGLPQALWFRDHRVRQFLTCSVPASFLGGSCDLLSSSLSLLFSTSDFLSLFFSAARCQTPKFWGRLSEDEASFFRYKFFVTPVFLFYVSDSWLLSSFYSAQAPLRG